mmetsp:Transcript_116027/g.237260  ORF Transcript_116027/g.237260 Transcript_116027/m.237260 type:complete len:509 (-) Transcript_116027:100-1626(-)
MQRGRTVTNSRFEPLRLVADRIMGASRRGTSALRTAALPPVSGASDSESSDSDLFRCETPSPDREPPRDEDDDDDSGDDDDDGPVVPQPREEPSRRGRRPKRSAGFAVSNGATAGPPGDGSPPHANHRESANDANHREAPRRRRTAGTPPPERTAATRVSPPARAAGAPTAGDHGGGAGRSPARTTGGNTGSPRTEPPGGAGAASPGNPPPTSGSVTPEDKRTNARAAAGAGPQPAGETPTKPPAAPTPARKKRLSVYEQLSEDARIASERWREDSEEGLRFKRRVHKEKLREIREKEDDLRKLEDQLGRLRAFASELERGLREETEKKKRSSRIGKHLLKTTSRAVRKATKDREDSRASIKAKDAVLKQAIRDANNANAIATTSTANHKRGSRHKRKATSCEKPGNKKRRRSAPRCSDDDDSSEDDGPDDASGSDTDDSDWEGAASRGRNNHGGGGTAGAEGGGDRRKTRARSSVWACTRCTLENDREDNECAVCGEPKPGCIPEFE